MVIKRMCLLFTAVSLATLLAACESGPKKTVNEMADALEKKDSQAFLAKMDTGRYAATHLDAITKQDKTLSTIDNLGKMFGVGGLSDLMGTVFDAKKDLVDSFTRGVSTGELQLECRKSERPDCPFVPESLRNAEIKELGPDAATARVTTPVNISSWLSLAKVNNVWLVVGQAPSEALAAAYAKESPKSANPMPQKQPGAEPQKPQMPQVPQPKQQDKQEPKSI